MVAAEHDTGLLAEWGEGLFAGLDGRERDFEGWSQMYEADPVADTWFAHGVFVGRFFRWWAS